MDIQDFRGNISTVLATHVKETSLTDEIADDYLQLSNEGRFACDLFDSLQTTHNAAADVMRNLATLGRTLDP